MRSIGRSLLLLSVLLACSARAQRIAPDQTQCYTLARLNEMAVLPAIKNGMFTCCSDCQPGTAPCVTGGTGSFATLKDGVWQCSIGGAGSPCFSPGPCGINDLSTEIDFYDPFVDNGPISVGSAAPIYGWTLNYSGTSPPNAVSIAANDFSRPGILRLSTAGNTNDVAVLTLDQNSAAAKAMFGLTASVTWYSQTAVTVNTSASTATMIGFMSGDTSNVMSPANFIGVRYHPSEHIVLGTARWQCYTCTGGVCSGVNNDATNGQLPAPGVMDTITIRMTGTETPTVECAVDQGNSHPFVLKTTNVPSAMAMTPVWGLKTITSAARTEDIDYWLMRLMPTANTYPAAPIATCSQSPTVIPSGGGTVSGTISPGANTEGDPPCTGGGTGRSHRALFQWTAPANGIADVRGVVGTLANTPVVWVRATTCTGTSVACANLVRSSFASPAQWSATSGTTYYIFVDTNNNTGGTFSLTLTFPVTNACDNVLTVPSGGGTVSGVLPAGAMTVVSPPSGGGCSSLGGSAVWYSWTPTETGYADAYLVPSGVLAGQQVNLAVRTACNGVAELACQCCGTEHVKFHVTSGSTYYILIDENTGNATGGPYTMIVTLPSGLSCDPSHITTLSPGTSGVQFTVTGDTSLLDNHPHLGELSSSFPGYCGFCNGDDSDAKGRGREHVYSWTPTNTGTAAICSPTAGITVSLRNACEGPDNVTVIACNASGSCPGSMTAVPVTGGTTYYIVVDASTCGSFGSIGGPYTLKVTPP